MTDIPSDMALVAQLGNRDQRALATLYDRYGATLYGLAKSILAEPADAEEVVEDVFMRIWDHPEAYRPERGSVGAFLVVIARSKALDRARSGKRRTAAIERASRSDDAGVASPLGRYGEHPGMNTERAELAEAVKNALDALPTPQRRALELAYYGGYSQSEIAARTREPLGTIKTRIRAGMEKLREALAPFGTGAPR